MLDNNNNNNNNSNILQAYDINPLDIIEIFAFKNNQEIILYDSILNINNNKDNNDNNKIHKLSNIFFNNIFLDLKNFRKTEENKFPLSSNFLSNEYEYKISGEKEKITFNKIKI